MPRTEARLFVDNWDDEDWCAAGPVSRDTYVLLLTQPEMTHCGVLPLREERWAELARVPVDTLRAELGRLEHALGWIVIDRRAGEVLIRSLIRRDKVLRQPKLWPALLESMKPNRVRSVRVRAALLAELVRTRAEGDVNRGIAGPLDDLIKAMEAQLDSAPASHLAPVPGTQPDTQPDTHGGSQPDTHGGSQPDTHGGSQPDTHGGSQPGSLMGEGAIAEVSCKRAPYPLPPSPSPVPGLPASGAAPPAAASPTAGAGEGEGEGDFAEALIAEIRELRPEWSPSSIRRTLSHPDVASRQPRSLIRSAALAVASDLATEHPGRLSRDGPWWVQRRTPETAPPKPPWCGTCHEQSRLTDEDSPRRCPDCHPLKDQQ